jgi:hypothetical protein
MQVMDITVHCLDQAVIKNKGLQEAFPAVCRFVLDKINCSLLTVHNKRKRGYIIIIFVMGYYVGVFKR